MFFDTLLKNKSKRFFKKSLVSLLSKSCCATAVVLQLKVTM